VTTPLLTSCINIDPGETTGIALLDFDQDKRLVGRTFLQADHKSAPFVLEALLAKYYGRDKTYVTHRFAGLEPFITGSSAGTKGKPAELTRQLAFAFAEQLQLWGYSVARRPAAAVKPWATDRRLVAVGFPASPNGGVKGDLGHAADGARHALYAAVHDAYMPDPLR
jgi:hypothetical protein